jgi:hypothetical protein
VSIFTWDTMKEVGVHDLQHQGQRVPGKMYEVELTNGKVVRVWRSDDGQQYFCHGLTFGGKEAPGGVISPYTGRPVETILQAHDEKIPEVQARAGDILVWRGLAPETSSSRTPTAGSFPSPRTATCFPLRRGPPC